MKKVKFDNLEPESVRFMVREIKILRRLDHPNIIKLEGVVTSRMSCSLYLVFEYMEHDLAGLVSCSETSFTEAQVRYAVPFYCFHRPLCIGIGQTFTSPSKIIAVLSNALTNLALLKGDLIVAPAGIQQSKFFDECK